MGRPYGKIPRTRKASGKKTEGAAFKIKLRSERGECLSMQEIRDGLFETARRLQEHEACHRAKWITIYMTVIGEDGKEVMPDPSGAWEICTYKSAADDCGV